MKSFALCCLLQIKCDSLRIFIIIILLIYSLNFSNPNINKSNSDGVSPIQIAINKNYYESLLITKQILIKVVELLANLKRFKIDLKTFCGTAMHTACAKNNKEVVKLLLTKNPDLQFT